MLQISLFSAAILFSAASGTARAQEPPPAADAPPPTDAPGAEAPPPKAPPAEPPPAEAPATTSGSDAALLSEEAIQARLPEARQAARFAESLDEAGDHYRAITEYKRALFLAPTAPEAARWELAIGGAYRRGEQFDAAAAWFDGLAAKYAGSERAWALLGAAQSYLGAGRQESAVARAQAAAAAFGADEAGVRAAKFTEGWALLLSNRDADAKAAFEAARGAGAAGEGAEKLVRLMPQLETLPHKDPLLAGMLGIVPGGGHLYLGDPSTAASALVWNGIFAFALYDAYSRKEWSTVLVLGLFEAMWYGGSIIGAIGGAHRFNRDARLNAMEELSAVAPPDLAVQARPLARP